MREQLIQYVELLFAGGRDCEEIKQEILQNTLDRYDDLIAEGKVPEAAYRLAITGIGDINEILGTQPRSTTAVHHTNATPVSPVPVDNDTPAKKWMRAIAVGLYILCPLPLIVLSDLGMDIIGLCGTLALVAVATVLIILGGKRKYKPDGTLAEDDEDETPPKSELQKSVSSLVWAIGVALYFILSFATGCWHITWVIFPILSAIDKLLCTLLKDRGVASIGTAFPAQKNLRKSINGILWAIGLAVYFFLSFDSMAWHITWLVFPITGAVQGLVRAILDYKEAVKNET